MKKVIFENGLRAFLTTLCFLVLGVVAVSAQSDKLASVAQVPGITAPPVPNAPVYYVPQGMFINSATAQLKLDDELVAMKNFMTNSTNGIGDPIFDAMLVKYKYYQSIKSHLVAGADVPNAIAAGLWIFLMDSAEVGDVSVATQTQLKADAINLLKA